MLNIIATVVVPSVCRECFQVSRIFLHVFHQINCIGTIKGMLFYYCYLSIFVFFQIPVCSCCCYVCLSQVYCIGCGSEDVIQYNHLHFGCALGYLDVGFQTILKSYCSCMRFSVRCLRVCYQFVNLGLVKCFSQ